MKKILIAGVALIALGTVTHAEVVTAECTRAAHGDLESRKACCFQAFQASAEHVNPLHRQDLEWAQKRLIDDGIEMCYTRRLK